MLQRFLTEAMSTRQLGL